MNRIDVLDTAVSINGQVLEFPMSYDELGLEFEGSPSYLSNLKRKKAYKDNDHNIVGLTLYVA